MPFEDRYSCAYVFVSCSQDGIVSMNSLEVATTSMEAATVDIIS